MIPESLLFRQQPSFCLKGHRKNYQLLPYMVGLLVCICLWTGYCKWQWYVWLIVLFLSMSACCKLYCRRMPWTPETSLQLKDVIGRKKKIGFRQFKKKVLESEEGRRILEKHCRKTGSSEEDTLNRMWQHARLKVWHPRWDETKCYFNVYELELEWTQIKYVINNVCTNLLVSN